MIRDPLAVSRHFIDDTAVAAQSDVALGIFVLRRLEDCARQYRLRGTRQNALELAVARIPKLDAVGQIFFIALARPRPYHHRRATRICHATLRQLGEDTMPRPTLPNVLVS
jgi:hypothetical protein